MSKILRSLNLGDFFSMAEVKPIDLAAIARLAKRNPLQPKISVDIEKRMLRQFADLMQAQGLTPVLTELQLSPTRRSGGT